MSRLPREGWFGNTWENRNSGYVESWLREHLFVFAGEEPYKLGERVYTRRIWSHPWHLVTAVDVSKQWGAVATTTKFNWRRTNFEPRFDWRTDEEFVPEWWQTPEVNSDFGISCSFNGQGRFLEKCNLHTVNSPFSHTKMLEGLIIQFSAEGEFLQ